MSNPEMSAVERYLMSDEARTELSMALGPTSETPTEAERFKIVPWGVWSRVWHRRLTIRIGSGHGDMLVAYFRPEGDRCIVTDLGEGVRALRTHDGCARKESWSMDHKEMMEWLRVVAVSGLVVLLILILCAISHWLQIKGMVAQ